MRNKNTMCHNFSNGLWWSKFLIHGSRRFMAHSDTLWWKLVYRSGPVYDLISNQFENAYTDPTLTSMEEQQHVRQKMATSAAGETAPPQLVEEKNKKTITTLHSRQISKKDIQIFSKNPRWVLIHVNVTLTTNLKCIAIIFCLRQLILLCSHLQYVPYDNSCVLT